VAKHLLVIEDSSHVANVIQHIGKSLGYIVTVATTLAEVKKLLSKEHNYFLATIDYRLPDALDGEVIPFVLQHQIPSVVMTGRLDDKTRSKILTLPVIDYITKENSQAYHYLLRILKCQLTNMKVGVLVVDDSLTARNQVCQLLRRRNFKVYGVPDGTKALEALEAHPNIKMVITDQEMPGMDGIQLVQKIRKVHTKSELVIIGISGANKSYQSARFIKNGADDFLRKPFCPEEFYCRIMQNVERQQHLEEIERAANTDYLTTLYNRRYFMENATKMLKAALKSGQLYILVMLDLDHFKNVNDTHGHDVGDIVLQEFAKLALQHFETDLVARLGGEEFAILIAGKEQIFIEGQVNSFREALAQLTIETQETSFNFTSSIGGVIADPQIPLKELLSKADEGLYQAKDTGRNKLVMLN
jgi:diguanylate cyclase (GGDEF)-like protein